MYFSTSDDIENENQRTFFFYNDIIGDSSLNTAEKSLSKNIFENINEKKNVDGGKHGLILCVQMYIIY